MKIDKIIGNYPPLVLTDKINEIIGVLNTLALDEKKEEPKPQCVKENGYFVCYCGKCEPDNYPLPADFPKQPKSTLREDIKEILCEAMYLKPEYLDPTGNKGGIDPTGNKVIIDPTGNKGGIDPTGNKIIDPTGN